jgi:hypothetical protein
MCIRFCFGSWELRNSTQYSVLGTQYSVLRKTKEQHHCTPSRDSPAVPTLRTSRRAGSPARAIC